MTITIRVETGNFFTESTVKAVLLRDGSNTVLEENITCTQESLSLSGGTVTPVLDAYTFTTTQTGDIRILLYESPVTSDSAPLWAGYVDVSSASGTFKACPDRSIAFNLDAAITTRAPVGAEITNTSPMSQNGRRMKIVKGDSYSSSNGQPISFEISGRDELIGYTPRVRFDEETEDFATADPLTSGTQSIVFNEVTRTRTLALSTTGTRGYQVRFQDGDSWATPIIGTAEIVEGY